MISCDFSKDPGFDKVVYTICKCKPLRHSVDSGFSNCPKFGFLIDKKKGIISHSIKQTSRHNCFSFKTNNKQWNKLVEIIDSLNLNDKNIDFSNYNEFLEIDLFLLSKDTVKYHVSHIDTVKLKELHELIKLICKSNRRTKIDDTMLIDIERYISLPPRYANESEETRFK